MAYVCIHRLTFRRGQLLRKRNFTIVPYSSSHDLHQAVARSPRSVDGPDFHIITNMSDRKVKQMMMMMMIMMVMMIQRTVVLDVTGRFFDNHACRSIDARREKVR
jgi:hypothetical protein